MSTETDKAEAFEACLSKLEGGESLETVVSSLGEDRDELQGLLATAAQLKELPSPQPSVRDVMSVLAKTAFEQQPRRQVKTFRRGSILKIAASVLILFFVAEVTVFSAANATPGDFLYPIKLLTEKIKFYATFSRADKADLHIVFSGERLRELVKKYHHGGGVDKRIFQEMLSEAQAALEVSQSVPSPNRLYLQDKLETMTALQHQTLNALKGQASDPVAKQAFNECSLLCQAACLRMKRACAAKSTPANSCCPACNR